MAIRYPNKNVDDIARRLRSGKEFLEQIGDKGGVTEVAFRPRRPGQNYYDTDEFLSRIGKPKIPHLMLERYIIHKSRNNPEQKEQLEKIRSQMDGDTKELADRYDAICADPKKLNALVLWGQHEMRIKPHINDRFYKLKTYGMPRTQFGSYYDAAFFVHLLSYESDALMKAVEEKKNAVQKFDDNRSATHVSPIQIEERKYGQEPDNFFRNFLIFAVLTSGYNLDDGKTLEERNDHILNNWNQDGQNHELLRQYDVIPETHRQQDDWQQNNIDTTVQQEYQRDDSTNNFQQDRNDYQQQDNSYQDNNSGGGYESPSPGE